MAKRKLSSFFATSEVSTSEPSESETYLTTAPISAGRPEICVMSRYPDLAHFSPTFSSTA